jgi:hypothetical protein
MVTQMNQLEHTKKNLVQALCNGNTAFGGAQTPTAAFFQQYISLHRTTNSAKIVTMEKTLAPQEPKMR